MKPSAWNEILAPGAVITDKKTLSAWAAEQSFTSGPRPACALKPTSAAQVQEIVERANAERVSLIPCSSSAPHFRGDTAPEFADAVIVDLGGMDKILRMDVRNKVAMIEPGVTFDTLQEAAHKAGLRLPMPLVPRRTKSVIASILEREPHTIPKYHWDSSDPMCCIEVVFGTGDLFRTGSAAGPGTLEQQWASGQAQKSPMGPSQTDFMKIMQGSQGTFGIVTWATIKLELKPTAQKAFFVGGECLEDIMDFTYAILKPKLPDECLILNRVALASMLTSTAQERDAKAKDLPNWILFYAVAGYEHYAQERISYIEADIADMARRHKVHPQTGLKDIAGLKFLARLSQSSDDPYWKIRHLGGCQDIFFLTTLDRVPNFLAAFEDECRRHALPPDDVGIYLQPTQQGRNVHVEFACMYDPTDAAAKDRIKNLYLSASRRLGDMGAFFSRPYGHWSDMTYAKCPDTVKALHKVKAILDPQGIMNPGKLCFKKGA
ncbi:MAG: FAD-binding oxidoreductase [Syntrophaceae bacterium]